MFKCSKCRKLKLQDDFYYCSGIRRSECKQCTIRRNWRYQQKTKAWLTRNAGEDRKAYMRAYYHRNKDKFKKYREDFKQRNESYFKEYEAERRNTLFIPKDQPLVQKTIGLYT